MDKMKLKIAIYLSLLFCLLFTNLTKAQTLKDCEHPCEKNKVVKYGAFIGVKIADILNAKYVLVQDVVPNTAAFTFGIQANDVITDINGIEMQHTAHLLSEIAKLQPGQEVQINILRQGASMEFNFPLGAQFSKTISVIECCDSLHRDDELTIAVSPDPCKDHVTVQSSVHFNGDIIIEIIDNQGVLISESKTKGNEGDLVFEIDTRLLKKGQYFLKLKVGTNQYIKRFSKVF
jgi:membrane-associated protease RseP (regulator of RpoE activity)